MKWNHQFTLCFVFLPGETKFGLTQSCITFKGQSEICTKPNLPPEWVATLAFIIIGTAMIFFAGIFVIFSVWKEILLKISRWFSFIGGRFLSKLLLQNEKRTGKMSFTIYNQNFSSKAKKYRNIYIVFLTRVSLLFVSLCHQLSKIFIIVSPIHS